MNARHKEIVAKMNDSTTIELATDYHQYMSFRSAKEGLEHDLDIKYYALNLAVGCMSFFGVHNDGYHLTRDDQKSDIFKEWTEKRKSTIPTQ